MIVPEGGNIKFYTGHPDINSEDKPLRPVRMLVTPTDNVLIMDYNTDHLHILNNNGDLVAYYSLNDTGMIKPFSLALASSGNIYIGSVSRHQYTMPTLYKLEYSGV